MLDVRHRLKAILFTPNNNSSGTFSQVKAITTGEDDDLDVLEDDNEPELGRKSRPFYNHTILCIRKRNLEAQSILGAVPLGKLVFSLDR